MYAIEIGVNLAVDKFSINGEMLDYLPWKDKESILTHAHIHAWHAHSDGEMFAKVPAIAAGSWFRSFGQIARIPCHRPATR